MLKQVHFIVTGFVQGVGYRKYVRRTAQKHGLIGWVRNNLDGTVEGVAVGDEEALKTLIEECKKGPFLSTVDNIHEEWEEAPQEVFENLVYGTNKFQISNFKYQISNEER